MFSKINSVFFSLFAMVQTNAFADADKALVKLDRMGSLDKCTKDIAVIHGTDFTVTHKYYDERAFILSKSPEASFSDLALDCIQSVRANVAKLDERRFVITISEGQNLDIRAYDLAIIHGGDYRISSKDYTKKTVTLRVIGTAEENDFSELDWVDSVEILK